MQDNYVWGVLGYQINNIGNCEHHYPMVFCLFEEKPTMTLVREMVKRTGLFAIGDGYFTEGEDSINLGHHCIYLKKIELGVLVGLERM